MLQGHPLDDGEAAARRAAVHAGVVDARALAGPALLHHAHHRRLHHRLRVAGEFPGWVDLVQRSFLGLRHGSLDGLASFSEVFWD